MSVIEWFFHSSEFFRNQFFVNILKRFIVWAKKKYFILYWKKSVKNKVKTSLYEFLKFWKNMVNNKLKILAGTKYTVFIVLISGLKWLLTFTENSTDVFTKNFFFQINNKTKINYQIFNSIILYSINFIQSVYLRVWITVS